MRGLTIKKQVSVNLSADQWELYTVSYPQECEFAASVMNRALENAINSGMSRDEVDTAVWPVMKQYSNLGATDSEPRYHLEDILDEVFG
jgi:hypothetical protein